jgi:hypothetical protein
MPRGSAPGERRGGRAKGTLNKLTIGNQMRVLTGFSTVDGSLELLRWALEVGVPNPVHRKAISEAIDKYIAASRLRQLI